MVRTGSQQILAQDLAPARRCSTETRTGHQRREGVNGVGNMDEYGNEDEYGDEHAGRDGGDEVERR